MASFVRSATVVGALASLGMAAAYTLVLAGLNGSWQHPLDQFLRYWFWIIPVILGFGAQMGLWRFAALRHRRASVGTAAATAGTGGLGMAACCAHHAADILPLLGLSAAATLVARYQTLWFSFALASNVAGIAIMVRRIQGRPLLPRVITHRFTFMQRSLVLPLTAGVIVGAVVIIAASIAVQRPVAGDAAGIQSRPVAAGNVPAPVANGYPARTDAQGEVEVSVTPIEVSSRRTALTVAFNTHSVELDYDFAEISRLQASGQVLVGQWSGGRGGHHLQGELTFPALPRGTQSFQMTMSGVGGFDRVFEWAVAPGSI